MVVMHSSSHYFKNITEVYKEELLPLTSPLLFSALASFLGYLASSYPSQPHQTPVHSDTMKRAVPYVTLINSDSLCPE